MLKTVTKVLQCYATNYKEHYLEIITLTYFSFDLKSWFF